MQKLSVKLKNAPGDAPQVPCSVSDGLNREETLSDRRKVLSDNSSEVDQLSGKREQDLRVPVINMRGEALMPTTPGVARRLLVSGKAKVVKRVPFVIQMTNATGENKQAVTCGVDMGYEKIGYSCVTDKSELFAGEVEVDNGTAKRMEKRRMYRRNRRSRMWRREPRFDNRKKDKEWLPPSTQRRVDTHIRLVEKLSQWLPINKVRVEVAKFDIQKIKNPNIEGVEYQQGSMYVYQNTKEYILFREKGKCQLCSNGWKKTDRWQLHHNISRNEGGTNKPDNLALLHKKCHEKLHKKGLKLKPNRQYKAETFMSIARWEIVDGLREKFYTEHTYGYKTKVKRNRLNLEKSHRNDAFVIAGGNGQVRCKELHIVQKHRNNRSLGYQRKGFAPSSRKQRYKIQPKDLVKINGEWKEAKGTHCKGERVLVEGKSVNGKNIEEIYNFGSFQFLSTSKEGSFLGGNR